MLVSVPHVVAAVPVPHGFEGAVPATYSVFPEMIPLVAAVTGIVAVMVWFSTSTTLTLAAVPPHCGPQFITYAVLSSELKMPQTGWSKQQTVGNVPGDPIRLVAISVMTFELSANARIV